MTARTIAAIARKESLHLMRDPRSLVLAFAIPALLILLFGAALSLDVEHIATAVVDHDRTPESRDFIRRLDASVSFDVTRHAASAAELTDLLDRNRVVMGVVIPPGWAAALRADRPAPLQVIIDGSDPNTAGNTRAFITAFIAGLNEGQLIDFLNRGGLEPIQPPVEGRIRVWFNEDLQSRNFIVPGIIAVIIMIVAALLTSLVIAREVETGTMETLRTLPVGAAELFLGKAGPYFLIALADVFLAILMGQLLFGVVMRSSFWLMVLASTVYIGVALCLGLLISTAIPSQLVANQVAVLTTYLPSLLLSDFVFPRANMPAPLQLLSQLMPATYYIDILNGLYLRNLSLPDLWPSFLVLALMLAVLAAAGILALAREGL
ncbi:MAG: ABC transporter permease [Desulfobacterales bacterium]|nr:ABC transporter permease [Desulfobacterales bacterium]